ncbi:MAG: hypothetical protein ACLFSA_02825 [Spirochaetaceae bacterium]
MSTSQTTTPEFCPNQHCDYHFKGPEGRRWYYRSGYYYTKAFGPVQRYRCRRCGFHFSQQTFRLDYFVKKPVSYRQVFERITGGGGLRGTGRSLHLSHQGIANRLGRLARQSLALQAILTAELKLQENLAADGFESFVTDQYMPNNIHILVGADSQFLYAFDYAHLRRKGRMSERQKTERQRREERYIRKPISITRSFMRIIDDVEQLIYRKRDKGEGQESEGVDVRQWQVQESQQEKIQKDRQGDSCLILDTDEKLEYRRVIEGSDVLSWLAERGQFSHRRTNSRLQRTVRNPLFPVNYLDRQIRKDNANHVRETVQFSRDVDSCMERIAVYQLFHNFLKPFRVDDLQKRQLRHAEVAGIPKERIEMELFDVFRLRKFYSHVKLSFSQLLIWARMIGNRDRLSGGYRPRYVWM